MAHTTTAPETETDSTAIWLPEDLQQPLETMSRGQQIGNWLINPCKNYLIPASWLQRLLKSSQSELLTETFRRPGSWRAMEILYRKDAPFDLLDRQALLDNPISRASRNRLQTVTQILIDLIQACHSDGPVILMGVGAGPGRHVQTAISRLQLSAAEVHAHLIDLDDDAFEYGQQLAEQLGISDCISFLQGDAREIQEVLPDVKPNIVKLIGLIEYLNDQQLHELLTALHTVMVPGGYLVTHGILDPWNGAPSLKRIFGLQHTRRSGEDVRQILETVGFQVTDQVIEPMGIYPIVTGVKPAVD
ncbi:Putative lysophospholipase [Gimesia panareensis]|uniref:Lysophospholipase n=1 Tax=Gimesia panareensis TaxID=2527978 RepID=A0A517QDS7_9PLAN|nr:class I SAM-dependent methyltransferase family protein [Gimesia panareensis]QDT29796.1 Putative lysophospholipase [Gimesia panareensis]